MTVATLLAAIYGVLVVLMALNIVYLRARRAIAHEPESFPDVSVIVPARNEARNLERLIPSILRQEYGTFEIVVYDDASEDDTAEVLAQFDDSRLRTISGHGPPPGWVGKVHAMYQATKHATGEVFLFLDADTELRHERSLRQLVARFMALPTPRVSSGVPRFGGGGQLLVSLVPFSLLVFFPVPLAGVGRRPSLGVLAGPCWMIERDVYFEHRPHEAFPNEVLDDVMVARYLKSRGAAPHMHDLQADVAVYMYRTHAEAWKGFRKNAYLLAGGPARFAMVLATFVLLFVVAPFVWLPSLAAIYVLKGMSDRYTGFSLVTTLLAPLSFALAVVLNIDSAIANVTGTVRWKGRVVNPRNV